MRALVVGLLLVGALGVVAVGVDDRGPIDGGFDLAATTVDGRVTVGHGDDAILVTGVGVGVGVDELELVLWALHRFELAGLDTPHVDEISFDETSPRCEDRIGWISWKGEACAVHICTSGDAIVDAADGRLRFSTISRHCLLHELGHAWLLTHAGYQVQRAFLDHVGLRTWYHPELPWHQRGVEHAAETLAWGLMDEEISMFRIGSPACRAMTDGFFLLTGVVPLAECSAEPSPAPPDSRFPAR